MPETPVAPASRSWLLWLVGLAGLAVCITSLWHGMREVMDVGGSCASGGAYEIATPCPEGSILLVAPAMPLGFLFAGIAAWGGSKLPSGAVGTIGLAWPALFLSLGFNFAQYGVGGAGGDGSGGVDGGFLTCAVVFLLMGGLPLGFVPGWIRGMGQRRSVVLAGFAAAATAGVVGGRLLALAVTG
ncbi:hypothetical protein [Conexibacter sp. SYSU D00693]|uniref:hypothetical protein n=1 Tax=Conexibacter sp. SYSU D00693 TaxID=2812560 RepID=UPI00196A8DB6|nr:hypothetical protein [Conexibacter sp. SYSU D00693]